MAKPRLTAQAVQIVALVGIAVTAPLLQMQVLTGPLVNATLFIAVVMVGWKKAFVVALFPSLISLAVGLLPAVLAPMVPFIILSNMILILLFDLWRKKSYWLSIGVASVVKFIFLYVASLLVIKLWVAQPVATKLASMMSWPQLITALAGGVIAYVFLKAVKRV
ncbi:MAG: hypothetical protein A2233_00935 [Candidatus Kerfeldbacteria bacterium RIFOXYA2_FULL_38_24]|uniref:Iron hydrogenase n=1 Tax=Candidatus Kerfeldbacteria bacterium RIFOXYB2_FULL_38_14 TaxID=1798547 RepID=A0A1G2BFZ5_9BACT|nr:MAG: hypothetical protein A2233_00935 [Candidatus Kerfeldbacteria bacterium RIFOXYA2_FULL_38_24]OGY88148.1 MAG: hypothetical protein A2319_01665 [Candidatus Kerfeldbacteria bacterium RIFOXYB2_FULL_38_14]OGY89609.1 MAG: hypothetical protein A2458_04130 [Candidatus Kerfeldbacteria bacterium RIFOXYC2_FULL_38_9]